MSAENLNTSTTNQGAQPPAGAGGANMGGAASTVNATASASAQTPANTGTSSAPPQPTATATTAANADQQKTAQPAGEGQSKTDAKTEAEAPRRGLLSSDEQKADDKAKAQEAEQAAQDDYLAAFKAPEGVKAEDVKAIAAAAKELGIPKEQAQKFLERDLAMRKSMTEDFQKQTKAEYAKLYDTWESEVKADKDFGGDKLPSSIAAAKRGMSMIFTAEERAAIERSAFVNNPLLFRAMARFGMAHAEDKAGGHGTPRQGATPVNHLDALFPTTARKA